MLIASFFSQRRFRPTSAIVADGGVNSRLPTNHKFPKSPTLPYGYNRTRKHLATDMDPSTPALKRFTNLNSAEMQLQQTRFENTITRDVVTMRPRTDAKLSRGDSGDSEFTSFSSCSTDTSSSNSPESRPPSWSADGNWTLKRNAVNSKFGQSESEADQYNSIDSPRSPANYQRHVIPFLGGTSVGIPARSPPVLNSSRYSTNNHSYHADDTCCVCESSGRRENSSRTLIMEDCVDSDITYGVKDRADSRMTSINKPDHQTPIGNDDRSGNRISDQPDHPKLAIITIDADRESETNDQQKIYRSGAIIDQSISPCPSVDDTADHYKSCPDLIRPCISNTDCTTDGYLTPTYATLTTAKRIKSRGNRRTNTPVMADDIMDPGRKHSASSANGSEKILRHWTLDDILTWLQKMGMEEVSSILVGYELSGSDLEMWDENILISYGITNAVTRDRLLAAVHDLKLLHQKSRPLTRRLSRKLSRSSANGVKINTTSLYEMIRRSGHDRIVAIDLPDGPQPSRSFTVAGRIGGGLIVSGCRNGQIPLRVGDIILEYNGENCLPLAAVDFHVLTSQSTTNNRIVVLRKSSYDSENSMPIETPTDRCCAGDNFVQDTETVDEDNFCMRL